MTEIIDNILPISLNKKIIKTLLSESIWEFEEGWGQEYSNVIDTNIPFAGMNFATFNRSKNINKPGALNVYADTIAELVMDKLNIKKFTVERFNWNYYVPGCVANVHRDTIENGFLSILYSLETCDGGIEIDGLFFKDISSQAKVFKSNINHRGIGPIKDKFRFSVNIVVEIN
jgi:hypothetical protein